MINGHGNDWYRFSDKLVADFSTNVVGGGLPAGLEAVLSSKLGKLANYPDPEATSLKIALAKHHQLEPENVIVCNGSTEAFYLIAHHFSARRSCILVPSFAEYEDACSAHLHQLSLCTFNQLEDRLEKGTDLVWIGNPNNPDGRVIAVSQIEALCAQYPNVHFVVDEAYAELCENYQPCFSLIEHYPNLLITRSLTKAFAVPGIRLGYILLHPSLSERLMLLKMPWSVNAMAVEAGIYILDHYQRLRPDLADLISRSKAFQEKLSTLDGLEVLRTNCNYFLIRLKNRSSADLKLYLIHQYGLLIRDASNFKSLDHNYFRIATQENHFNELLFESIKQWLSPIS